ncbi:MAG: hypothetical protein IKF36_02230 [Bacilli bacterium]|nr:hypothetical protein [Bacilli bacterium]
MNYDYNANLSYEERIGLITRDIMKEYPINKELAMKIATIEEPIDTDNKEDAMYKRLSNILFFVQNDKVIKNMVIEDMLDNYKSIKGKYEKIDQYINDLLVYIKYDTNLPEYK